MLLEADADPDDGESVYHATEAVSPECLRALIDYGATLEPIHLAHALDDERPEHVRLLLEGGVDATELLPFAVRRGRGPRYLRMLVDYGAELEHRAGEGWRNPERLRTAYQHAVLRNADDSAALLASLGADTHVDADDLAVAAIARGERPDAVPEPLDYDQQEVLVLAALRGQLEHVVELFGPDFRGVVGGSPEASLLQHAAWVGDPQHVRFLLGRGADVGGALDAAVHGSGNVAVAELLVEAGAVIEPRHLEVADGPLAAWLEAR